MGIGLCSTCAQGQFCASHPWEGGMHDRTPSSVSPANRRIDEVIERVKRLESKLNALDESVPPVKELWEVEEVIEINGVKYKKIAE